MLRVSLFFAFTLTMFVIPTQTAEAGWDEWHAFWNRAHLDKLRNNCWPQPFIKADRRTVCQTLSVQLAKGWQRQNTLSAVYFDQDTHALNEAGRRKLASILTNSPPAFNTVYVVRSYQPGAQERRMASVQETSVQLFEFEPNVVTVNRTPHTWPADYIDKVNRAIEDTIPSPRLPERTSTTSN